MEPHIAEMTEMERIIQMNEDLNTLDAHLSGVVTGEEWEQIDADIHRKYGFEPGTDPYEILDEEPPTDLPFPETGGNGEGDFGDGPPECDFVCTAGKWGTALVNGGWSAWKTIKDATLDLDPSEAGHLALDFGGMIPGPIGIGIDSLNTIWYAAEGDEWNAFLTGIAIAPVLGQLASLTKLLLKLSGDAFAKALLAFKKLGGVEKLRDLIGKLPDGSFKQAVLSKFARWTDDLAAKAYSEVSNLIETWRVGTPKDQAIFYSGPGKSKERIKKFFGDDYVGKTIFDTEGGRTLDQMSKALEDAGLTRDQIGDLWAQLSKRYADEASGTATVVLDFSDVLRKDNVFETIELPALNANPNVHTLVVHTLSGPTILSKPFTLEGIPWP